jgi:hypothetical protein
VKLRTVTVIALAAVGGFLYVHRRRGGKLTLASLRDTALDLLGSVKQRAAEVKDRTEKEVIHDVASNLAEATAQPPLR